MDYYVTGADGKEYGPVAIDTLRQWSTEGRVSRDTQVRSFETGVRTTASQLPGLFPSPGAPPVDLSQHAYGSTQVGYGQPNRTQENDMGPLWNVLIRCALAIGLFFALHGIGLIFAGYALFYAIQAKSNENRYGVICIVISSITLVILIAGWALRLGGAAV